MHRSSISTITNLANAITKPTRGDYFFLDLDDTLVLTGLKKYQGKPSLIEPEIVSTIKMLRERGIKVIGLTARKRKHTEATLKQLQELGIELDEVIHAEDQKTDQADHTKKPQKWKALLSYVENHKHEIKSGQLKRIFVFDDKLKQLDDIEQHCQNLDVPVYLKHFIIPQYLQTSEQTNTFPETLDHFTQYEKLGGGTESVLKITDTDTHQNLVLKFGAHEDAGKCEILGNAVYELMGVKVPAMRIYNRIPKKLAKALNLEKQHGKFKVCEFIDETKNIQNDERTLLVKNAARQYFLAHVLMGNIDIAKQDNFIVDDQHHIYMIDAGANFLFRSKGKRRKENPSLASEIDSLRDSAINYKGAEWFKDLSHTELCEQLDVILAKIPEIEKLVWELSLQLQISNELRDQFLQNLSDRLDNLKTRLQNKSQRYAKIDKKANTKTTAAGVLTYQIKDGKTYVLLSKRVRHAWWDNFGGKSEAGDESLAVTAMREVAEESEQQINYTEWELLNSPSHDIVTGEGKIQFIYRMYLCPYGEIDLSKLTDDEHTEHAWVPLTNLLAAIQAGETIELENIKTGTVQCEGKTIPIYPPLFKMLNQQPVVAILKKLQCGEEIKRTTTLSHADSLNEEQDMSHPLMTPQQKRNEIANNHLKKAEVLCELKKNKYFQSQIKNVISAPVPISQTEVYLKAHLGDDYKEGNIQANVEVFVTRHYRLNSDDERKKLIAECVKLIKIEKEHGSEYFYTYHGVNNTVAFSYDVYTALYSILQASENWAALRDNNEFFQRFENITQFMAFFSNDGNKKIHNNDNHYNDCAIAANVFLFGCHDVTSSSSILYLLKNSINRSIDLKTLLNNIFKPFNVTEEEITRLISVYKQYAKKQGGRLYQIAMTHDDTRLMSYAAKAGGRVLKFQDSHDLIDILQNLRTNIPELADNLEYISKLQARVILPPSLRLQTNIVRWAPLTEDELKAYHSALKQVVSAMVYKMLSRYAAAEKSDKRQGALLVAAPHVLRANDLNPGEFSPEASIMKAIQLNDENKVHNLLQQFPGLLQKKIHQAKQYIDGRDSNIQGSLTVISYIMSHSKLMLEEILDFSDDGWINLFDRFEYFSEFKNALLRIPENHRIKLVMKYHDVSQGSDQVCEILNILPSSDRLILATQCRNNFEEDGAIKLANTLLPEQRLAFVSKKISNVIELAYVLPLIDSEPKRIEVVKQHITLITSCWMLASVLKKLSIESRCEMVDFALSTNKIDICSSFVTILGLLPEPSRLTYAIKYPWELIQLYVPPMMRALPEGDDRLQFATHMLSEIRKDYVFGAQGEVVTLLDPDHRLAFIKKIGKINNAISYHTILEALKPEDRLDFALTNQIFCVDSYDTFSKTLAVLGDDAYAFLEGYLGSLRYHHYKSLKKYIPAPELYTYMSHHIHDADALICTLSVAPLSLRLGLVTKYRHLLDKKGRIDEIVILLPQINLLEFALQCTDDITYSEIQLIANLLDPNDKITFLLRCINDMSTLIYALAELPNDELEVARKYKSCIEDCYDLSRVINFLKHDRLKFVIECIDNLRAPVWRFDRLLQSFSKEDGRFIISQIKNNRDVLFKCIVDYLGDIEGFDYGLQHMKNAEHLRCMIARVPVEVRLAFAYQHQSLIVTSMELLIIVSLLPEKGNEFAMSMQDLIQVKDIGSFMSCFPKEDRLAFAIANKHMITNRMDFSFMLYALPNDKRLEFKKSCINNVDLFDYVVFDLPKTEAFSFAMQYKHLISSSSLLYKLLIHFEYEEQRYDFIHATDGQIQDNEFLNDYIRHLPRSEKLSYIYRNLKDGWGAAALVGFLPQYEIVSIINQKKLIHNCQQLEHVIQFLPEDMRRNFIVENRDKIDNFDSIIDFSKYFQPDEILHIAFTNNDIMIKDDSCMQKFMTYLMKNDSNINFDQLYQLMITHFESNDHSLSYEEFTSKLAEIMEDDTLSKGIMDRYANINKVESLHNVNTLFFGSYMRVDYNRHNSLNDINIKQELFLAKLLDKARDALLPYRLGYNL